MAEKKNVRIRLFKDNSRYKGDLFVSVNGMNYKIRRGVEVEVPPEVAEVLEHFRRTEPRGEFVLVVAGRPKPVKSRKNESETEDNDEQ